MKIVCWGDTHGHHEGVEIPDGDIFIFVGDYTGVNSSAELHRFNNWLGKLPHETKIFIAGNHDRCFESDTSFYASLLTNAHYLQDSMIEVRDLRIWGSPYTPRFLHWAFNRDRGKDIRRHWDMIPDCIDILITHGPPQGILDCDQHGESLGCHDLFEAVVRVQPSLHVFGHIHASYGIDKFGDTIFMNVGKDYHPKKNPPIVFNGEL